MSRKRIFIIHNPTSGRRSADLMGSVVRELVSLGARVDIRVTEGPGHATELASKVTEDSQDCIVAAGGDGTVNEVLNGLVLLNPAPPLPAPPLGIIALGTANVLAIELGLPKSAAAIARILFEGPSRPLYPGLISCDTQPPRLFAQMAGVGLDARIVAGVSGALKRALGKGAYAIETLYQWLRGGLPSYQIDIDGVTYQAASMVVANGRHYGGRFVASPDADIGASGFEILLLGGSRLNMLSNTAALMTTGLSGARGVRVHKGMKINISGPSGEPVQADGDLMGRLPVIIEASSQPIMVIAGN